jgi:hypothetical protein
MYTTAGYDPLEAMKSTANIADSPAVAVRMPALLIHEIAPKPTVAEKPVALAQPPLWRVCKTARAHIGGDFQVFEAGRVLQSEFYAKHARTLRAFGVELERV